MLGVHLAWSGNHSWFGDRLADGRRYLQLGELLHPGEIALEPGERHRTPDVVAVWSDAGLTPATQRFHRRLRQRAAHPTRTRPVLINTWEAVYFDHDLDTEMVNPDSDLYRAHPEWALTTDGYEPPLGRNQLRARHGVRDLGRTSCSTSLDLTPSTTCTDNSMLCWPTTTSRT